VDRQAEEQEKQKMAAAVWNFDGHPRRFREILSRRKKKKGEWLSCHLSAPSSFMSLHPTCPGATPGPQVAKCHTVDGSA
jgi:hypothetical protein